MREMAAKRYERIIKCVYDLLIYHWKYTWKLFVAYTKNFEWKMLVCDRKYFTFYV